MIQPAPRIRLLLAALLLSAAAPLSRAAEASLYAPTAESAANITTEKGAYVTLDAASGALKVVFPEGAGYPGFDFPISAPLDLSAYAGVQVDVTNNGSARININLRADNRGDWKKSPWNTNNAWIAPGETKTVKLVFGQSYGNPGYALDASRVSAIKLFAANPKAETAVLIANLRPFGAGSASPAPAQAQAAAPVAAPAPTPAAAAAPIFVPTVENIASIKTEKDPVLSVEGGALKVAFPEGGDYPGFDLPLAGGQLNLSAYAGIQIQVTNTGASRINVNLRADNPGDWKKSPWNTNNTWIAPGETKTLKLTFGQSYGNPGYPLDASRVSNVKIFVANPKTDAAILIKNIAPFGVGSTAAAAPGQSTSPAAAPAPAATLASSAAPIFVPTAENIASIKTEKDPVLSLESGALKVAFPNGGDYPGFDLPLPGGQINLAAFAGIQAEVTNTGSSRLSVNLRAGNPGDWKQSPWNANTTWIAPGETKIARVVFGQSYGHPGYALDASHINNVKIFVANPKADAAILVKNIVPFGAASGGAPAAPAQSAAPAPASEGKDAVFSPSIGGDLLDLAKNQLDGFAYSESSALLENGKIKVTFNAGSDYPNIQFPLPKGGWNLSAFGGVEVTVTNPGEKKVNVFMRVDNPGHWKTEPWNTENLSVGPGQTKTLRLTFGQQNGAPAFPLNPARISGIQLFIVRPKADTTLVLSDLKAAGSPADAANNLSFTKPEDRNTPAVLPDWLGKRPPADLPGSWVQTLDENFDGKKLNDKLWTPRFPWDGPQPGQLQRYAPENVSVANGIASFKAEKKAGHENNDPALGSREYTSGLIQSFGKWTQLYGYFEARIKVPYTRGLWPAFWMMPDRGPTAGDQWKRRDTGKGAMEIDIMEILSEWGPGRNSVATHWDGYGADHKQWGTSQIYFGPTPDGYHVYGLLWEPGKLTWYVDGKKVAEQISERVSQIPAYLKLNVQMGGWASKDVDVAALPSSMEVDYVRAWQLKDRLNK